MMGPDKKTTGLPTQLGYLSTIPAPDGLDVVDVVGWAYRGPKGGLIVTEEKPSHAPEARAVVDAADLAQAQSALAAAREANKALMNERTNLVATKREQLAALTTRAETAEAEVKRLTEANEALMSERDRWQSACMDAREGCNQRSEVIRKWVARGERLEARIKALEEALGKALASAKIVLADSRQCSIAHHHVQNFDDKPPQWWADVRDDINAARATLNSREKAE